MNVYRLLRFFLPLQNPLGFTLTDTVLLATALLGLMAFLWRDPLQHALRRLANRPILSAIIVAALPIALRLALLPHHPVPQPSVSDDFAYLLLGDTLAHFRLANPVHPCTAFSKPSSSSRNPPTLRSSPSDRVWLLPWDSCCSAPPGPASP